jgi:hypothetical protein
MNLKLLSDNELSQAGSKAYSHSTLIGASVCKSTMLERMSRASENVFRAGPA